MSPPLSVVLPVYNAAATLGPVLDALARELPPGAELIVVDDASTDGSAALAEARGFTVLKAAANAGPSAARNRGWRAARAPLIAFVDADLVLRPGALAALTRALEEHPELLGVNGLLDLDLSTPGLVTAFTNTSIHFQHLRHGRRVATSFTALCVLRRAALEAMGGFNEAWTSRYADDVDTRYALPPESVGLVEQALGDHLKRVALKGLVKHRFNIGLHWVRSGLMHQGQLRDRPGLAVLDLRFPLNTLAGGLLLVTPLAALAHPAAGASTAAGATLTLIVANASFLRFTLARRGRREALAALPLCAAEGIGCAAGVLWGIMGVAGQLTKGDLPEPQHEHA